MPGDPRLEAWRSQLAAHAGLVEVPGAALLSAHDLPLSRYEVLLSLHDSEAGRLRMHELARSLLLSRRATTRFVERMERAGLVVGEDCDSDRRGTFVTMTGRGREVFARAAPFHLEGIRRRFAPQIADEEALVMANALRRVAENVRSTDI